VRLSYQVTNLPKLDMVELREGKAVMIFVTEPFSTTKLVIADQPTEKDISVLKLNFTKNFITNLSLLHDDQFFYLYMKKHALKIVTSIQNEWWTRCLYS
jgi:hypothetical protein